MDEIKPDNYMQIKKMFCDWTDKKKYLILYKLVKFHYKNWMIVDKFREIFPNKQNKWLEKYKNFKTQNWKLATTDFEKDIYKLRNNSF